MFRVGVHFYVQYVPNVCKGLLKWFMHVPNGDFPVFGHFNSRIRDILLSSSGMSLL